MHWGPRKCVDPEPFANVLQLNHAIQQVTDAGVLATAMHFDDTGGADNG